MKNYQKTDYAINKKSEGIVYKFTDKVLTITKEDYLKSHPDKTEQDFLDLKVLSDGIYYEQDRTEYNTTRKNISMHEMEEVTPTAGLTLEEDYIDRWDKQTVLKAYRAMVADDALTETQHRRFCMYVFGSMTHRQIAKIEGVNHRAVGFSLKSAIATLKKYFEKF